MRTSIERESFSQWNIYIYMGCKLTVWGHSVPVNVLHLEQACLRHWLAQIVVLSVWQHDRFPRDIQLFSLPSPDQLCLWLCQTGFCSTRSFILNLSRVGLFQEMSVLSSPSQPSLHRNAWDDTELRFLLSNTTIPTHNSPALIHVSNVLFLQQLTLFQSERLR